MFIIINPANPDPLYQQISDQIKQLIADGTLKPNILLPSVRELSKELNVSTITTKRAYTDLEYEGYIMTRPGLGTFVAKIDKKEIIEGKIIEIRKEIKKIICEAQKYNISKEQIIEFIEEIKEGEDDE